MTKDNHIARIVAYFGTYRECAKAIGVTSPAVYHWCYEGRISSGQIPVVIRAARKLNPPVKLTPNDFFPEDLW